MPYVILGQKILLLITEVCWIYATVFKGLSAVSARHESHASRRNHLMAAIQHQPGYLFNCKFGRQVLGAFMDPEA